MCLFVGTGMQSNFMEHIATLLSREEIYMALPSLAVISVS